MNIKPYISANNDDLKSISVDEENVEKTYF